MRRILVLSGALALLACGGVSAGDGKATGLGADGWPRACSSCRPDNALGEACFLEETICQDGDCVDAYTCDRRCVVDADCGSGSCSAELDAIAGGGASRRCTDAR
jgi:hypothetical protein